MTQLRGTLAELKFRHGEPEGQRAAKLEMMRQAMVATAPSAPAEGGPTAWADITDKPPTFAPVLPIAQADISGLVAALAGKEPAVGAVNGNTGTYGGMATVPQISVNGKGQITGVTAVAIDFSGYATTGALTSGLAGKQPLAAALTGTTASFTAAQETKLAGIAPAATANSADATLLARANHTGTQAAATISDFNTAADARVAAGITGKENTGVAAGLIGALTKASVGLGSVDNTADTAKPVSTAQQTALNLKAPLASPQFTGLASFAQPAPTALAATATLTIAQILTLIITASGTTAKNFTLPTGTLTDAGIVPALAVDQAFEWYIINIGTSTGAVTLLAGTGHTIVGNAVTAITTTSRWLTRKTAANTFVTYRIA